MESFKRNIYRTSFVKKSEEPVPEPKLWYISRGLTPTPDFCIPIDEIVYSQEQSITVGMVLYSDTSLTQLAISIEGNYLISSTFVGSIQPGSRTMIEVDENSTVLNIEQATCVAEDSTAVFVSPLSAKRCDEGSAFTTVYVSSSDIDSQTGQIASGGVQLYSDQLLNNTLDPLTLGGSFSTTIDNFVGISPNGTDPAEYSMLINISGVVIQPQDCV